MRDRDWNGHVLSSHSRRGLEMRRPTDGLLKIVGRMTHRPRDDVGMQGGRLSDIRKGVRGIRADAGERSILSEATMLVVLEINEATVHDGRLRLLILSILGSRHPRRYSTTS